MSWPCLRALHSVLLPAAGAWAMRTWLKRENKKIRQLEDETVLRYAY